MRWAATALGWTAAALAGGCVQPRTELVLQVDSEVAWGPGQRMQSLVVSVRRGGVAGPLRSVRTTVLGSGSPRRPLPLSVGVIAADDDLDTPVWIEVLGCAEPNGCTAPVVAQRAVVRFVRGATQALPLLLASACVGTACASDERCATTGRCEPATQAQGMVRPFDGTTTPVGSDAAVAMDVPTDHGTVADVARDTGRDAGTPDAGTPDVGTPPAVCPSGMRFVPAGQFLMGSPTADDRTAQPVHGVQLTAFCLDETGVTVAAYRGCPASAGCSVPDTTMYCNWGVAERDQHPINCLDWSQSRAYCQWRGGDLPTEAQWEYAARGTDGRTYPWGNDAPGLQLCWNRFGTSNSTCPVRSYPSGVSPFGLFDLAGNLWEWTRDAYGPYTGDAGSFALNPTVPGTADSTRAMRGGSWYSTMPINVRATNRNLSAPATRYSYIGFRCAHSPL